MNVKTLAGMLAGLGVLASAPAAQAQMQFTLTFPDVCLRAIHGEEGAAWDLVRRYGLVLTAEGELNLAGTVTRSSSGGVDVVVVALAVDKGKVVNVWRSRSQVPAGDGSVPLSGKDFLPGWPFPGPAGTVTSELAGTPITVADAMRAIDSGSASAFLGRTAADATGLVLIAIPALDGASKAAASSTTNPRFARTERFTD
ncbi:MAG: hypothetical protein R6X22_10835 [Gemmatimonadota bacterium]